MILAHVTLRLTTGARSVALELPGVPQTWPLDLSRDPEPMPGFSPWRSSSGGAAPKIEMNFRLKAG